MKVYELQHVHFGEIKMLGFFSNMKKCADAIEKSREREEFRDFPTGFVTFERTVPDCRAVYLAAVYIHDEDCEFEYTHEIGLFSKEFDATNAAQSFIERNRGRLESDETEGLCIELLIDTYKLDEM